MAKQIWLLRAVIDIKIKSEDPWGALGKLHYQLDQWGELINLEAECIGEDGTRTLLTMPRNQEDNHD